MIEVSYMSSKCQIPHNILPGLEGWVTFGVRKQEDYGEMKNTDEPTRGNNINKDRENRVRH